MNNKKTNKPQKKPPENDQLKIPEEELPIPEEILDKIGPENREMVKRAFSATLIQAGLREHPFISFLKKLTSDHITTLINNDEKENIRRLEDRKDIRKNNRFILLLITGFIIFICTFFTLTNNKDTLYEMLKIIAAFAGGFGAGFGASEYFRKK